MAKGDTYPVEILTPDEAKALIAACSRRAPTGIRNAALIAVMYRCGLRVSEALALKAKDIDQEQGTVTVLRGKGGKRRVVALDDGAARYLDRWLDRRHHLGMNGHQTVFCTLTGDPLDPSYVRHLLKRLGAKAGIQKRVHPHQLRHTHAAELAREGVPVNVVQQQLGHSSLATTSVYLAHIAPAERVEQLRHRDW